MAADKIDTIVSLSKRRGFRATPSSADCGRTSRRASAGRVLRDFPGPVAGAAVGVGEHRAVMARISFRARSVVPGTPPAWSAPPPVSVTPVADSGWHQMHPESGPVVQRAAARGRSKVVA
ncbi:hypothetical protein SANTM175S_07159 [Streptomyces antimycoticus]